MLACRVDASPPPGLLNGYNHWGTLMPQNIIEPNNIFPPEYCGVANYSQIEDGLWGWADTNCTAVQYPYMCKTLRESAALHLLAHTLPLWNSWRVFEWSVSSPAMPRACFACPAAALGAFYYTSPLTNVTYLFNNTPVNAFQAELACQAGGGHLVSFTSVEQQQEIEEGFMTLGGLQEDRRANEPCCLLRMPRWPQESSQR